MFLFKSKCQKTLAVVVLLFFFINNNKAQTFYYSKSTGNLDQLATWGPNTNGSGTSPLNFSTAGRVFIITNRASATIGAAWSVSGTGSKVQLANGTGGVEFIVPSTFAFTGTIDVTNTGTLTLQNSTNPTLGTLSAGSTVNYGRSGNQTVLNTTYYNLVLSGSGQKSLANTLSSGITNSLIINTGATFRLHTSNTLSATISGSISGGGAIVGNANSNLIINGTGNLGTLTFTTTLSLYQLIINRTVSGLVTLGSNLTIGNALTHNNGTLDLNGRLLTLNGAISFPTSASNGALKGSSTSSITIGASTGTITNALLMDQTSSSTRSLGRFSLSRVSQTLTLGADLMVVSNFVHSNGVLNLNGRALSISGVITFPAAIANGSFLGSGTSTLSIEGAGAITNSLKMNQASAAARTIRSFTLNHTGGTLSLGNDLISSGAFVHTNGVMSIGATSLSLNGTITFPLSAANGSITGSATSSLSVGGSGAVTNSMIMSQASAAARTFNNLSVNRPGAMLALGNALIVNTLNHTNGIINLSGTLLTLNSAINFPASAANGYFTGSASASLSIGTSTAAISNSLFMDQTTAAARTLARLGFNRTGQTLRLGNDLIVSSNYVQTNGLVDLNGKSLSIGGIITFPAAVANGYFIGSSASNLSVEGAGTITNSLKLDQTNAASRSLNAFTINHTGGTVVLGNNITCSGPFTHVNGPVTIGTTSLSLNGAITFPAAATNGSFTGSATSSLSIGGTGAITNALFMSQASTAARTLNNFSLNRSGAGIVMGNQLTVNAFAHTNGTMNINGLLLSLNGVITFPAGITNGSFIGSTSSSLSIGGSGAISNALLMQQGSSSNLSLYNLTLNRSGQTLNIGNPLEIRNAITPTAGNLITGGFVTLKSDATRSAMIGVVGNSISGNITVETYAPAGYTGWTNLGPSGVSGLTVANWENQMYMTCLSCPNNEYSAGGYFVSIQKYNEAAAGNAAYVPMSYTDVLTRGQGYWVYLGTGSYTTAAITYSVAGPVVSGNVIIPVTLSANSGYNLVANPYAAPIDWDLVAADGANTNINGSVYFYNPDLGQTVSYAAGVSNPSGYISNGIIPMGQGFYIRTIANTNIIFRETHKSTQNTSANPLLKSQQSANPGSVFRLSVVGPNSEYDETTIRFHPDATSSYDRLLDAEKIFQTPGYLGTGATYSLYTSISSRLGNDDYSINSVSSDLSSDFILPILVKAQTSGSFVISPIDIQNFSPTSCVILIDNLLNKQHDLRTGPYVCTISDTTSAPRFALKVCAGAITEPVTTGLSDANVFQDQVLISQAGSSEVFVKTKFNRSTRSVISVYNLIGQKIISDREIEGTEDYVQLDLKDIHDQLIIVKVQNENGQTTKKVYVD